MGRAVGELIEEDVIAAVCDLLVAAGWTIEQRLTTSQQGIDIVARRPDHTRTLMVEAKGATSSKASSARNGRPFSRAQIASHVARAFYAAASIYDEHGASGVSAIALPRTPAHGEFIRRIESSLRLLGIGVIWVETDGTARLEGTWSLTDGRRAPLSRLVEN